MVESHEFICHVVDACKVRPFVGIAVKARNGQIRRNGFAAVLPCDNMVQLEWRTVEPLRHLAVLTMASGTMPDRLLFSFSHDSENGRSTLPERLASFRVN